MSNADETTTEAPLRIEAVDSQFSLERLRMAAISPFLTEVFNKLVQNGGWLRIDTENHLAYSKVNGKWVRDDALRNWRINELNRMIGQDLIGVDRRHSEGFSWMLVLTDEGRQLCTRLEQMNVSANKVDVQMNGSVPEVKS